MDTKPKTIYSDLATLGDRAQSYSERCNPTIEREGGVRQKISVLNVSLFVRVVRCSTPYT